MSAKHTPGPWFWTLDARDQPMSLRRSGDGAPVADPQVTLRDSGADCWTDVSEADAHLIAAAPELLEALRLLVADCAYYPAWQRPCHALEVALAAIAKATGGEA